jgi:hypothetical protein
MKIGVAYARICEVYEFPPIVLIIMTDSNSKYSLYWLDLVSSSDGQLALQTTYSTALVMTQRALQMSLSLRVSCISSKPVWRCKLVTT